MPMKAKREQRAVAISLPGDAQLALDGLFVAGAEGREEGAVIAPPHPLFGGSMDSPIVNELAWAFRQCDVASLCFNWRGVGASAGATSGAALDARADYGAALAHLAETVAGPLSACGYSWGAATAVSMLAKFPRVKSAILVAPPPAMLESAELAAFPHPILIIAGSEDTFVPLADVAELAAAAERAELLVVPDADHFFLSGLADIGRAARDWIDSSVQC